MATALFISRTDLVRNSILDGNVDTDKFIQFIKLGQEIDIQNLLGTDLYNRISTDIENQGIQAVHTHGRSFHQTLSYRFENRTFSESISHNLRVIENREVSSTLLKE